MPELHIPRAAVSSRDAIEAVAILHEQLGGVAAAAIVLFVAPDYDREVLQSELARQFAGVRVLGCTTAGEIGPTGVSEHGITGFALPASHFVVAAERVTGLRDFDTSRAMGVVERLQSQMTRRADTRAFPHAFAMMLVDGLSNREEALAAAFDAALGSVPMFGGSAGDGGRFLRTQTLCDGTFTSDSAVLLMARTALPVRVFKSQHLVAGETAMLVTGADREHRLVRQIDGEPAAHAYARAIGLAVEQLDAQVFAEHPMVVRRAGRTYVHSVRESHPDGSLTFYCAIDHGDVLRLAEGVGLTDTLQTRLEELASEIGPLELVIGCDCILRRLEASRLGLNPRLSELYAQHRVVGFGTYGEQYRGVHVNQTFTGVAIGSPERRAA